MNLFQLLTVLEWFPVWGPLLAVVSVVLLVLAARATWGTGAGDNVPGVPKSVPAARDNAEDGAGDNRLACEDTDPDAANGPGTGVA